jgi:type II secretory pathway predicted ATPase ExeA
MTETNNGQHFATRVRVEKTLHAFFREAGRGKGLVHTSNLVKFNPGLVLLMGDEGSGRSRMLTQFAESMKNKPGKICVLNRSIKNESHLYEALLDGFGLGAGNDSLESMKKTVMAFLETHVEANKPVVIALDDVHQCSLAMLEALIALQKRFKAMSLILVGDNTLQKMLERLLGSKMSASSVVLSPLNAREIRQYIHWRLPFTLSDLDMTNMITLSHGNMALLEQEAKKREVSHQQRENDQAENSRRVASGGKGAVIAVVLLMVAGLGYSLYQHARNNPMTPEKNSAVVPTAAAPSAALETEQTMRSSADWVEKQMEWLGKPSPVEQTSPQ